jgi:hypothetical protein
MKPETVTEAFPAVAAKVGWTGALMSAVGAASLTDWMAIAGFFVALIGSIGGLLLNAFFRFRRDRREQKAHDEHTKREQAIYDLHAAEILSRASIPPDKPVNLCPEIPPLPYADTD